MDGDRAARFLAALFRGTLGDVYLSSLPNERGGRPGERSTATRDPSQVVAFAERWNKPGRGLFFAVSTLAAEAAPTPRGSLRCKANAWQLPAIHVDIDFDKIAIEGDNLQAYVVRRLERLPIPPDIVIGSGGGIHAYWLLDKPLEEHEVAEGLMRSAANLVAGDPAVAEVARLMRLPGSTNSKRADERPVVILKLGDRRHVVTELRRMFQGRPVLERRVLDPTEPDTSATPQNVFESYATRFGVKLPVDIEARLAAMTYQGAGEAGIHLTQLSTTASLLGAGHPIEAVVERVFEATAAVAPPGWNLQRERADIERMCRTWLAKRVADATAEPRSNVTQLKPKMKPAAKKRQYSSAELGPVVGEMVKDRLIEKDVRLLLTGGELHFHDPGVAAWRSSSKEDEQTLEVAMHREMTAHAQFLAKAMDAAWRYIRSHPDIHKPGVVFDATPELALRNGMLDLKTRQLRPHKPEDYITRWSDIDYDPLAVGTPFFEFLETTFGNYSAAPTQREDGTWLSERGEIITAFLEFLGASLKVKGLEREQRCALWLHGPSNTGKTELGNVVRGLLGGAVASPSIQDLNGPFGLAHVYGKAGLVTDEAAEGPDTINANRFKVLVTGEPTDVAVKKKDAVTGYRFDIPVVLIGNSLPRVTDETQALFNRSLVIRCARVFTAEEAVTLRRQLGIPDQLSIGPWLIREHGSGILNAALDARDRLLARGRYEITPLLALGREAFREQTSDVHGCIAVAFDRDEKGEERRADVLSTFHGFQLEDGVVERRLMSGKAFWPKLRDAAPWCKLDGRKSGTDRYVGGLRITAEGHRLRQIAEDQGR